MLRNFYKKLKIKRDFNFGAGIHNGYRKLTFPFLSGMLCYECLTFLRILKDLKNYHVGYIYWYLYFRN